MFKIDVCKVCGVNCFWIEGIDGDLAEKEVCSPECLAQLAVCPTRRAVDEGDSASLQAESTPEHLPIEEAESTPALSLVTQTVSPL